MPVVLATNIEFGYESGYCLVDESGHGRGYYVIGIAELSEVFPHLELGKKVELYLLELRNELNKLIKRFKPFRKLQLQTGEYWQRTIKKWVPCLLIPEDLATQLNVGKNYKVIIVITRYDGKVFLPLELKCVGYDAEKALEYFSKIETDLLLLTFEHSVLNEASSYLWDAYFRLEENDIEGARTAVRNSLSIVRDKLLSRITVPETSEEISEFPKRLRKLTADIRNLVHYGGPHPGPAPRTTTEMTISLTIELIKYLAKALERGIITEVT